LSRTSNAVKNMKREKVSNGVGLGGGRYNMYTCISQYSCVKVYMVKKTF